VSSLTEKQKLIEMIKQSEQIQRYKAIEKVINDNQDLKDKINQLKTVQKQLVNAKEIQKEKAIIHFQEIYDSLLEEIEGYPLMSDYLALQGDINEMIQAIAEILEDGINNELNGK
jgi:cell fate (sporulation/competence/biofilm development) regulator YmcA (YheA/YmcA/DUF963 family)